MLDSLKLILNGGGSSEEEYAADEEVTLAGDIRAALDAGDDEALAAALKQFIYACMEK